MQIQKILQALEEKFPNPRTELNYSNEYELTVAVLLAAQCTDKRVNKTTPDFFARFPDFFSLAEAEIEEILSYIKSISYPNNKAKYLKKLAQIVVKEYGGKLPQERDALQKLPGIGRKSANVLAGTLFHKNYMPVDTHVQRVANRLGIIKTKNPHQTEKALMQIIPKEQLLWAHHLLVLQGRYICKARKPLCEECNVTQYCKFFQQK